MLAANADVRTNWGAAVLRRYKNQTKRETWYIPIFAESFKVER